MGIARAKIKLENLQRSGVKVVESDALVRAGSPHPGFAAGPAK